MIKVTKLPNGGELLETYKNKYYYLNGKLHREDGPAIEFNNTEHWYLNGKLHREDGPALEDINGNKFWYINDKAVVCNSQEEFERLMRLKAFW
jgi:hypothetical protein